MKYFSVHSDVYTPLQIVFLNNFENCRSPSKMKPFTLRDAEMSKKYQKVVMYKIFIMSECSCWCTYEGIQKQIANNSWTIPTRISYKTVHFYPLERNYRYYSLQTPINTCRKVPLQVNFFKWQYIAMVSTVSTVYPFNQGSLKWNFFSRN